MKYNPLAIEKKWQNVWEENKTFKVEKRPINQNTIVLRCFPILQGKFIWGM